MNMVGWVILFCANSIIDRCLARALVFQDFRESLYIGGEINHYTDDDFKDKRISGLLALSLEVQSGKCFH